MLYTPYTAALRELKQALTAWKNANPENAQQVKESFERLQRAKENYKEVRRIFSK